MNHEPLEVVVLLFPNVTLARTNAKSIPDVTPAPVIQPWSSKIRDRDLKASLLTFIEWDHQVRHGPDHDVRFLGSRLRKWMDDDVQQALEQCWGHFDAVDSAKALRASIALFAMLGKRIADGLGFGSFHHGRVHREIEAILAMHPGTG